VSTLGVAAAFQPLRRRVQRIVDRRFNRARYDARRTVDEFASRLREDIDLDLLAASVSEVARATIQPTQVSIWFPEGRS
jgi:predicted unusual protein kinase regulating ubiquinone biosynthesis (AarF/ABC1/UbiB family)